MDIQGACCAHLRVKYMRINNPDQTCSDSWLCEDCVISFAPLPKMTKEEKLEAIKRHVEKNGINPIGDGSFKKE